MRVRGDFPSDKTASNVFVSFMLPDWADSVSVDVAASPAGGGGAGGGLSAGRAEVDRNTHSVAWLVPKLPGGGEVLLRAKIILPSHMRASSCDLSEFGLVKVNFEIPMFVVSGIQVSLVDAERAAHKWVSDLLSHLTFFRMHLIACHGCLCVGRSNTWTLRMRARRLQTSGSDISRNLCRMWGGGHSLHRANAAHYANSRAFASKSVMFWIETTAVFCGCCCRPCPVCLDLFR